ncbi:PIG-L family deacetylase [Massilia sp. KIM]|uniref:PIG-L deacetylase family protein n=1 Tax=Massilia sp. KIM TaxID=1955422 RepID=UPI00098FD15C|nr:PIG-L family deacetylase [Massilia sp. KIM]OON60747.1 PIG-L family deacetylase [Massilia sp. KIM]
MPTERCAVFLFAHQDDEFGVLQRIRNYRRRGLRVACAYLTDGQTAQASAAVRNAESLAVLAGLGVGPADVAFAGQACGIGDARLPLHLDAAAAWLRAWLDGLGEIEALYLPAWEGGHHDHDALHALGVRIAAARGLLGRARQFPLYQAAGLPGPLFRVLAPLPENGPAEALRLPWGDRLRNLRCCLSYPSQRVTWLGLFPFVLLHTLARGVERVQAVDPARLAERPHAGPLYYEKRQFFTWERLRALLDSWHAAWPASPADKESRP